MAPELAHDDIRTIVNDYANILEPEHPYKDNPYPIIENQIDYGYKQKSSPYYASCGPRSSPNYVLGFSADKHWFNNVTSARVMAIITHELTHVTVGNHSDTEAGGHPPRFWREFGFNAHLILDNWERATSHFDADITKRDYIGYIVSEEVNQFNIDRRYGSLTHRRHEFANWFKNTLQNTDSAMELATVTQRTRAADD